MNSAKLHAVTVVASTPADTRRIGVAVGRQLLAGDLVVLNGELGSGKTTLTQGIGEGLDVRTPITSPTFVISRVHPSLVGGPSLVHSDAYRLVGTAVIDDLDLETIADDCVLVVEWGRGRVEHLSQSWLAIDLVREKGSVEPNGPPVVDALDPRTVQISGHGKSWTTERFAAIRSGVECST